MAAALRHASLSPWEWLGIHVCVCGATSGPHDVVLPKHITNTLCLHYVAHHRGEVPLDQLREVAELGLGEAEPTRAECAGELALPPNPEVNRAPVTSLRLTALEAKP
jgi:hypothetical protein